MAPESLPDDGPSSQGRPGEPSAGSISMDRWSEEHAEIEKEAKETAITDQDSYNADFVALETHLKTLKEKQEQMLNAEMHAFMQRIRAANDELIQELRASKLELLSRKYEDVATARKSAKEARLLQLFNRYRELKGGSGPEQQHNRQDKREGNRGTQISPVPVSAPKHTPSALFASSLSDEPSASSEQPTAVRFPPALAAEPTQSAPILQSSSPPPSAIPEPPSPSASSAASMPKSVNGADISRGNAPQTAKRKVKDDTGSKEPKRARFHESVVETRNMSSSTAKPPSADPSDSPRPALAEAEEHQVEEQPRSIPKLNSQTRSALKEPPAAPPVAASASNPTPSPEKQQHAAQRSESPRRRRSCERTITFDEIYCNGNPPYYHMITEFDGKLYILKCDEHSVHFGRKPLHGAAKHLASPQHPDVTDKKYGTAVAKLGILVLGCDAAKQKMNNTLCAMAFANGYRPLNANLKKFKKAAELSREASPTTTASRIPANGTTSSVPGHDQEQTSNPAQNGTECDRPDPDQEMADVGAHASSSNVPEASTAGGGSAGFAYSSIDLDKEENASSGTQPPNRSRDDSQMKAEGDGLVVVAMRPPERARLASGAALTPAPTAQSTPPPSRPAVSNKPDGGAREPHPLHNSSSSANISRSRVTPEDNTRKTTLTARVGQMSRTTPELVAKGTETVVRGTMMAAVTPLQTTQNLTSGARAEGRRRQQHVGPAADDSTSRIHSPSLGLSEISSAGSRAASRSKTSTPVSPVLNQPVDTTRGAKERERTRADTKRLETAKPQLGMPEARGPGAAATSQKRQGVETTKQVPPKSNGIHRDRGDDSILDTIVAAGLGTSPVEEGVSQPPEPVNESPHSAVQSLPIATKSVAEQIAARVLELAPSPVAQTATAPWQPLAQQSDPNRFSSARRTLPPPSHTGSDEADDRFSSLFPGFRQLSSQGEEIHTSNLSGSIGTTTNGPLSVSPASSTFPVDLHARHGSAQPPGRGPAMNQLLPRSFSTTPIAETSHAWPPAGTPASSGTNAVPLPPFAGPILKSNGPSYLFPPGTARRNNGDIGGDSPIAAEETVTLSQEAPPARAVINDSPATAAQAQQHSFHPVASSPVRPAESSVQAHSSPMVSGAPVEPASLDRLMTAFKNGSNSAASKATATPATPTPSAAGATASPRFNPYIKGDSELTFEVTAYSEAGRKTGDGVDGDQPEKKSWAAEPGSACLRLVVFEDENDRRIAATTGGSPVKFRVEPARVATLAMTQVDLTTMTVDIIPVEGPESRQRLTFSRHAGNAKIGKIQARKFCAWVREVNPEVTLVNSAIPPVD